MKKIKIIWAAALFILMMLSVSSSKAQGVPVAQKFLSTITDLRIEQPQTTEVVQLMGLNTSTDGNGGSYSWSASSTATDDGFTVIAVTGVTTGRWLRIPNNNRFTVHVTITPVALQYAYQVSFGQTLPIVPADVQVQPTSANGAIFNWTTSYTTTGCTLNFPSIPVGSCTFNLEVFKQ